MKNLNNLYKYEESLIKEGYQFIAGVDEVGRGPLAAGVLACACILNLQEKLLGINDSKKLSEKKRKALIPHIKGNALDFAYGYANETEVDHLNIYQASKLAMKRAVNNLKIKPDFILVDAMTIDLDIKQLAIIKGDTLSVSIASASILAKVKRDEIMEKFDKIYPGYGFKDHKGYPTKYHIQQLKKLKPCKIHRLSYKPVQLTRFQQASLHLGGEKK